MDPEHGQSAVPAPPESLPTPTTYGSISSELKLADLKLQSTIGSEVYISVPLYSNDKARPGQLSSDVWESVSYIQLANISKIPREQFYGLLRFFMKN